MNRTELLFYTLNMILPIVIAIFSAVMMLLAHKQSGSSSEVQMKQSLFAYFICIATTSFCYLLEQYGAFSSVWLAIIYIFANMLTPAALYGYVHILTELNSKNFLRKSYFNIIGGFFALTVISVLVFAALGQEAQLFLYGKIMYLIFCLLFASLSTYRIHHYNKAVKETPKKESDPQIWLTITLIVAVSVFLLGIVELFFPRTIFIINILLPALHIILAYNIIRRNFLFFHLQESLLSLPNVNKLKGTVSADTNYVKKNIFAEEIPVMAGKGGKKISKPDFEKWLKSKKPFLNPDFKITDAAELLQVNRTYVSDFVNRVYKINFNRLMNRYRLKEMVRLMALQSNKGKKPFDLWQKAGFGSYKSYRRAKKIEENG